MEDTKDERKKKKLFPFGDYDKDGVPNFKDCEPFDPTKHVRGGSYSPSGGGHSYSPPSSRGGRGGYTPSPRGGYTFTRDGTVTRGAILSGARARQRGYTTVYGTLIGTPMGEATYWATRGMSSSMRGATIGAIEKSYRSPMTLTSTERALIKPHLAKFPAEFRRKFFQAEMKIKLKKVKKEMRPKDITRVRPPTKIPSVPAITTGLLYGVTPTTLKFIRETKPKIAPAAISIIKKGVAISPAFLPITPAITLAKKIPLTKIVSRYEKFIAPAVGVVKHKMDIARAYSEATTPEGLVKAFEKTEGRKLTETEREKVTKGFEKGIEVSAKYRRLWSLPKEEMEWEREGAKFQARVKTGQFGVAEKQFIKQIVDPIAITIGGKRAKAIHQQEETVQANIKSMDQISARHPEWRDISGEIILPTQLKPEVMKVEKRIDQLQTEAHNRGWITLRGDLRYPDTAAGRTWARSYTSTIDAQKKFITPDGSYKEEYVRYIPEAQKYYDDYRKYETSLVKLESLPKPTLTREISAGLASAIATIPISPIFLGRIAGETIVTPTKAPGKAKQFAEEYYEFTKERPGFVAGQVIGMAIPAAGKAPIAPKFIRGVKVTPTGKITYTGLGIRGIEKPKPGIGVYKEVVRTPEGVGVQRAVVFGKKYPAARYIKTVREAEVPVPEFGKRAKGFGREIYREVRLGREGVRVERMRWKGLVAKDYLLPERAGVTPEPPLPKDRVYLPFEKPILWKRVGPTEIAKRVTALKKIKQQKKPWGVRIEKPMIPTITEVAPGRAYRVVKGYDAFQIGKRPAVVKILRRKWDPKNLPKVGEKVIHRIRKEIIERKAKVLEYRRPKGLLTEGLILDIKGAKIRRGERPLTKIEELYEKITADDIYREIKSGKISKRTVRTAEDNVARERPDWLMEEIQETREIAKPRRAVVTETRPIESAFFPEEFTVQPEVAVVPKKARRVVTKERVGQKFEYVVDKEPSLVPKVDVKKPKILREPEAVVGRVNKTKDITGIPIFEPKIKRKRKVGYERKRAPIFGPAEAFFRKEKPKKEPFGIPIYKLATAPLKEPKPSGVPLPKEYPRPTPKYVPEPVPEPEPVPVPEPVPEPKYLYKKPVPEPKPKPKKLKPKPEPVPEPKPKPKPETKEEKQRRLKRLREKYYKYGEITPIATPEQILGGIFTKAKKWKK